LYPVPSNATAATTVVVPTSATPQTLAVSVNNKTVTLAEGSDVYEQKVTLSAYVIGGKRIRAF